MNARDDLSVADDHQAAAEQFMPIEFPQEIGRCGRNARQAQGAIHRALAAQERPERFRALTRHLRGFVLSFRFRRARA